MTEHSTKLDAVGTNGCKVTTETLHAQPAAPPAPTMYECHKHGVVAGDHCPQCRVVAYVDVSNAPDTRPAKYFAAELEAENKRLREENERLQGQIDDVADALGCKEKTSHRHSHGRCLYAGISKIEHDWAALVVAEKRKLTAALTVLKAVEWGSIDDTGDFCPKCQWEKSAGHAAGCILAAVLNNGGATDGR